MSRLSAAVLQEAMGRIERGGAGFAVSFFYSMTLAQLGSNIFSTFGAVFFGCAVYIAMLLLIGGILEEDMERIPMIGHVSIRFLRKIGVFKIEKESGDH